MTQKIARLGDGTSHGGTIQTASPNVYSNGAKVARLTDQVNCPIHGATTITTASSSFSANGKKIARIGDSTSCGATITSGSPNVDSN